MGANQGHFGAIHRAPQPISDHIAMRYFEPQTRPRPDFPAGSREYEPAIAWWLAECSRLAYDSKRRAAAELESADFCKVTFFDNGGAEGYLAVHRGTGQFGPFAVLAFRGTEDNFRDILTDVNFFKRKSTAGNVRVHGGFLDALALIWGSAVLFETRGRRIDIDWKGTPGVSNALDEMRVRVRRARSGDSHLLYRSQPGRGLGHFGGQQLSAHGVVHLRLAARRRQRPGAVFSPFGGRGIPGGQLDRHRAARAVAAGVSPHRPRGLHHPRRRRAAGRLVAHPLSRIASRDLLDRLAAIPPHWCDRTNRGFSPTIESSAT